MCGAVFRTRYARCPSDGTELGAFVEDPLLEATFEGRYVIEECVGEGAMGRVYRARHTRVSRHFAVKVLFGDHAADPKMRERFAREAEAASRLQHPNVVPVLDFGETAGGLLYLVMDYVDGPSLATLIDRDGPLSPDRVRRLLRQLCGGLAHAHERGLVHRDFKSENVLITGGGEDESPRIADFGIAILLEGAGAHSRLTTDGMVLGTPAYMAPEQATLQPIDHRTDLFSLGVAVYEMLAGALPFDGEPIEMARKNLNDDPPPIAERAPHAPGDDDLEAIARKLMAKDPAERVQSAREVGRALDEGLPPPAPAHASSAHSASVADRPGRPANEDAAFAGTQRVAPSEHGIRRRGVAIVTALALVSLVGAIAAWPWTVRSEEPAGGDERATGLALADEPASETQGQLRFEGEAEIEPGAEPEAETEAETEAADEPEADAALEEAAEPSGRRGSSRASDGRRRGPRAERDDRSARPREAAERVEREISREALTFRYRAVGAALQGLADTEAGEALREAYLSLPYAASLGDPARRAEVYRELARLEAEVRRLERER